MAIRVIDFFCGAGGFSEGFRQQGFDIVMGVDKWQPAINSHNLNHGLKSFSMSNRAGKANKTDGIRLVESYLRVIAVKKNKEGSILKAWFMENVPKSRDFIRESYNFEQLNLSDWALQIGRKPTDIALDVKGNILNAGDFGAPQERKRFIAGELIGTGEFVQPVKTHDKHKTVSDIKSKMPKVTTSQWSTDKFTDPNYPNITLTVEEITDHFYDTGVHKIKWEKAEFLKTNHPFMGKMSFPENEERTSRTILATRSAGSREALLYESEFNKKGDGQYRLPTVREAASLMGFPYSYQFFGSEGTKWRQIGNSVCPHQSAALAKALRDALQLEPISDEETDFTCLENNYKNIENLNVFQETKLPPPGKRKENARFRRHAFKLSNMTIDLMNYHPDQKDKVAKEWYVVSFFGTGTGYKKKVFSSDEIEEIETALDTKLAEK